LNLRPLTSADAEQFQALRLAGLLEFPSAFASSHAEEVSRSLADVAARVAQREDSLVLGAFDSLSLVGVVGVYKERNFKLAHKANLWGLYVAPAARRSGVGRALVQEALACAERVLGALQVNLGVNASNVAALRLYERLGFSEFGREQRFMLLDGVPHDEVHMVCWLDAARPNSSIERTSFGKLRLPTAAAHVKR
jgi:ribosomal protein S18 acetylase RimI-like enzyme